MLTAKEQRATVPKMPKSLAFLTEKILSNVQISKDNIITIINNLDSNKTHGHDKSSTPMLKLCEPSLCKHQTPWLRSEY